MGKWRLIQDPDLRGADNMAKDEAILRASDFGAVEFSTLRIYGWRYPTISVGYIQNPSQLLDFGIPVVRRITGGRAVLHDQELTYSITVNSESPLFSEGITGAYSIISRCIINALGEIGVEASFSRGTRIIGKEKDACFHAPSRYEVLVNGRKLVGSSQRRFKNAFLQHGSILFGVNGDLNARVFGGDVVHRMAWVGEFSTIDRDAFRSILINKMAEGLGADFMEEGLNETEEALKDDLASSKYSKPEWNHSCVRRYKDGQPFISASRK
ncbi:MAG: lipoate--protein ligase family protein [Deltaproteobacteria bacterium]|nr:lipoate--protein ligase family protein [Deltaproteobacteria bacterium]